MSDDIKQQVQPLSYFRPPPRLNKNITLVVIVTVFLTKTIYRLILLVLDSYKNKTLTSKLESSQVDTLKRIYNDVNITTISVNNSLSLFSHGIGSATK